MKTMEREYIKLCIVGMLDNIEPSCCHECESIRYKLIDFYRSLNTEINLIPIKDFTTMAEIYHKTTPVYRKAKVV